MEVAAAVVAERAVGICSLAPEGHAACISGPTVAAPISMPWHAYCTRASKPLRESLESDHTSAHWSWPAVRLDGDDGLHIFF